MNSLSKSAFLFASLLLVGVSVVLTAQSWFSFEMNLNDDQLQLQSFDGFSAFAFTGPIFGVIATAILLVPLSSKRAAKPLLASAGVFTVVLVVLLGAALLNQDFSGLASELETATGIAQAHGLNGAKVSLLWPAFAAPLALTLLAALLAAGFSISGRWAVKKPATPSRKSQPDDSIGLWDSQR